MHFVDRLFGRRAAPLLGLDIAMSGVRVVQLAEASAGRWALQGLGFEPLERGWVSEGQIEDFDAVTSAVRRAVERIGAHSRHVALALPAAAVMTRRIMLPAGLREDEMEQLVLLEAEQHIPFPLDEVSLDFDVVGPAQGDLGRVEVFVAASRQERVQDRQGVAEAAGLVPTVLDIESHAGLRALRHWLGVQAMAEPGALLALFELDGTTLSLQVLQDQAVLHAQEQPFSALAGTGGASVDAAARQIGQGLQQFFASTPHHAVDHLLMAGPAAATAGLAERVAALTGFDTRRVEPFDGMPVAATVPRELLQREGVACLVACGLAMRRDLP